MQLDYNEAVKSVHELLASKRVMVLATSLDNRVTARSMSCVFIDNKICLQTDRDFLKYHQIIDNPRVALAVDNIQVEGRATIKGHPFEAENRGFTEAFKAVHSSSYHNYSHMENEVVVEIVPTLITLWRYEEGRPFRDFLDLVNQQATRAYYDNSK